MQKRGRIVAFLLIVLIFAGTISTTVSGISKKINLGLDLQGGFEVLYEVEPIDESQEVDSKLLDATFQILNDVFNCLGSSDRVNDIEEYARIRVHLVCVEVLAEAREMLATRAR